MEKLDPKDYFGEDYREFDEKDPFNDNQVQGYISRRGDNSYGALLIESVNWEKCPQLIYCTPKIPYPFDKTGNWHFPKAKKIERYEKLDGTNIFSFRYHDAKQKEFVSHKTRLLPFVGNSRFGPFRDMVVEIFGKTKSENLPLTVGYNVSYELWGAKNPHLVKYDTPLELSILFFRNGQKILPPSSICLSVSSATLRGLVDRDYIWNYEESQKDMDKNLKDEEDGYYTGCEGEVWYLLTEDGLWHQFKCKPETIETIHWSAGGIGKNQIIATCENAFENWDAPTVENVIELLKEEFSQDKIDKIHDTIEKRLKEVFQKHEFIENVVKDYEELGINILENKGDVMRALSGKYDKKDMRRVYSVVWNHVAV